MKLHEQNRLRALRAQTARGEITRFRSYLSGAKFTGYHPQDGSSNSWISTHEVFAILRTIEECLDGSFDEQVANATYDEWTIQNAP